MYMCIGLGKSAKGPQGEELLQNSKPEQNVRDDGVFWTMCPQAFILRIQKQLDSVKISPSEITMSNFIQIKEDLSWTPGA